MNTNSPSIRMYMSSSALYTRHAWSLFKGSDNFAQSFQFYVQLLHVFDLIEVIFVLQIMRTYFGPTFYHTLIYGMF